MNLAQHRAWSGFRFYIIGFAGIFAAFFLSASYAADPLPSRNDGVAKTTILEAEREYAYDRKSHVGTLDKALDQADANDWIIVSMKDDWKQICPGKENSGKSIEGQNPDD